MPGWRVILTLDSLVKVWVSSSSAAIAHYVMKYTYRSILSYQISVLRFQDWPRPRMSWWLFLKRHCIPIWLTSDLPEGELASLYYLTIRSGISRCALAIGSWKLSWSDAVKFMKDSHSPLVLRLFLERQRNELNNAGSSWLDSAISYFPVWWHVKSSPTNIR